MYIFTARSNLVAHAFELGNSYKDFAANDQIDSIFMILIKYLTTGGCLHLPRGYIHVYYIQSSEIQEKIVDI